MTETLTSQELPQLIFGNFVKELQKADEAFNSGLPNRTSLAYINNPLPAIPLVNTGEHFQAIVIGGTIGKTALIQKTSSGLEILSQDEVLLPSFTSTEDFLAYIKKLINNNVTTVGINFAYPLQPTFTAGKLDGILLDIGTTGKAVSAPDFIGKTVGTEIENYMRTQNNRRVAISVGNDGVCLLLSAKAYDNITDGLAFGIVGTGVNFGFMRNHQSVINLESHAFDKFPQSRFGKYLASLSGSPFGKEVNGENLYRHFNYALNSNGINYPDIASTEELSMICNEDISEVSQLAQRIITISAHLVTYQIAGIVAFKKSPMTFVMEGSLFWKGWRYHELVAEHVAQLVPEYPVNFVEIENSGILGAAKLVA